MIESALVLLLAALAFLLLQVTAFASVPGAASAVLGLGVLHLALGRVPALRLARPGLEWRSTPRPAEA